MFTKINTDLVHAEVAVVDLGLTHGKLLTELLNEPSCRARDHCDSCLSVDNSQFDGNLLALPITSSFLDVITNFFWRLQCDTCGNMN